MADQRGPVYPREDISVSPASQEGFKHWLALLFSSQNIFMVSEGCQAILKGLR